MNIERDSQPLPELDLPAIYPPQVFLRPHHITIWYDFLNFAVSYNEQLNKSRFLKWSKRNHVKNAKYSRNRLLAGEEYPSQTDGEIEYLSLLSSSSPQELSNEDKQKLENVTFVQSMFSQLSEQEFEAYQKIYALPNSTNVMLVRGLDFLCQSKSQEGYMHCRTAEYKQDQFFLLGAASLEEAPFLFEADKELIEVRYSKEDEKFITAVILPLYYLKLKQVVLYIWDKAREFENALEDTV
jgi:hypothetical protein